MNTQPPKWADRFLAWYCNPDLLEEIQGDAHEIYAQRVASKGKRFADIRYLWDVIRFCRWSNIKRTDVYVPGSRGGVWNMTFKIAMRHAGRNKMIFAVKTLGLSIALAFSLLLTSYVVNELTFDQFHPMHDRTYRVSCKVNFQDHITHYAITPLPIGQAMIETIPEIEAYTRIMYQDKPIYHIGDQLFNNEITLAADSSFLNVFHYQFLQGDARALNEPNKLVITESTAQKFFGDKNALGQFIPTGKDFLLEVAAVIKDVPANSHLKFDVLVSWDTFHQNDEWSNINAYTYVVLKEGASLEEVKKKMPEAMSTFSELVAKEYKATYEIPFEPITDIHFSESLDEDIADKKSKANLYILAAVIMLFTITGIINYLNLTLAEITSNLKKIGIIRVFGGRAEGHRKILTSETILTLLVALPLTLLLGYVGWQMAERYLSIHISTSTIYNPLFIGMASVFLLALIFSIRFNSYFLSKASHVIDSLKGKMNLTQSGMPARKTLVGVQLSFSIIMIALVFIIVDQFHFIQKTDKGFDISNTLLIRLRIGSYSEKEAFKLQLEKFSGVSQVGNSSYYPGMIETKDVFQLESEKGIKEQLVHRMNCSYDYIDLLNITIKQGRDFDPKKVTDIKGAYLINEAAARQFGWKDPIGKKIAGPVRTDGREGEVIGVLKDFNFASMYSKIDPLIIFMTNEDWGIQYMYVKLAPLHSPDVVAAMEKEFKKQWPEFPFEWEYLDTRYLSLYERDYEVKSIFEIGLFISVLISCLGIFSISALLATLRTKEMGIRKLVGASSVQLFLLHISSFLQFILISIIIACPIIWYLSDQWLQNFAYHIELNYWYFIIPGMLVLLITLLTSGYHGIRNALTNPIDILKSE